MQKQEDAGILLRSEQNLVEEECLKSRSCDHLAGNMVGCASAYLPITPVSLVERVMTPQGVMLLGSALLLMAGAFGGLLLIARLIKVCGLEDETGQSRHLAATTPNVFLWSAIISAQIAHDPSSVSGMLMMWAMLIFFVGLVIREQWLWVKICTSLLFRPRHILIVVNLADASPPTSTSSYRTP